MPSDELKAYLDDLNTLTIQTTKASIFYINGEPLKVLFLNRKNQYIIYKAYYEIDLNKTYIIKDDLENTTTLEIRYFVKSPYFDEMFYYDKNDLGATYSPSKTTFKLWAPIASRVILHYEINDFIEEVAMERQDKGVFAITIYQDLEKALYYYIVTNNNVSQITLDPYAYSCNANSKKSAVINLDRINVIDNSCNLKPLKKVNEAIIYELSVRDFSMDGSFGDDVKGTFKAFLKEGYKSKNHNSIGLDYLKELGITHVQLMPVLDFATVNEENIYERYNWGYDPLCYNVIEGSYATNPEDPYNRIIEFLEMVSKLHEVGLRVNLDVVFNHTYSFIDSIYNKIIPNYFYLMDEKGQLSNGSFCGNDIDTTKKMVHKYFIDMCLRYVSFYKIDGLRLDLMGILTQDLVLDIYHICKNINPNFMLYGEGWDMPSLLNKNLRTTLQHAKQLPQIAFFNDYFRDTISGKTYNNFSYNLGFLTGDFSLYYDFVKAMRGSIEENCYFLNAASSINYVECHDNFTLYDKLKITNANLNEAERNSIQLCCLMASVLALGIPFIHAGCEFNRSKKGIENSYNASDDINMLQWDDVDTYSKNIKALKDFISIRKKYNCFTMSDRKKILNSIDGQIVNDDVLTITYACNGQLLVLVFNPSNKRKEINLNGDYTLLANQYGFVKQDDKVYNNIVIKSYSILLLIK